MTQPTDGLQFWAGGDFLSTNIGPAAGDHLLGTFSGAGVYLLVGDNAAGKSQHLALLGRAQGDRLLKADANITDGAMTARFELGAMKIAFRRGPTGEMKDPERQGLEAVPTVESMPHPIQTLITADGLKGKPERVRRRLQALLTYVPVTGSADLAEMLCGVLEDRAFSGRRDLDADWIRLAEVARTAKSKIRIHAHQDAGQLRLWLLDQDREGVLEDHELLMDHLNLLGNTGEHAAGVQGNVVSRLRGRLSGAAEAAWRITGGEGEPTPEFVDRLGREHDVDALSDELGTQRETAGIVRSERESRRRAEAERERLQASHGDRPDTGPAKAKVAEAAATLAERLARKDAATDEEEAATTALTEIRPGAAEARARLLASWRRVYETKTAVDRVLGDDGGWPLEPEDALTVPEAAELTARVDEAKAALDDLVATAAGSRDQEAALGRAERLAEVTEERRALAVEDHGRGSQSHQEALVALGGIGDLATRWDEVDALLADPIEGPVDADVEQADARASATQRNLSVARAAVEYQRVAAELEAARDVQNAVEADAAAYRKAAKDSWEYLGAALTEALGLPWLSLDGTDIVLHYDRATGRLREDAEVDSEGRSIDDESRISAGELNEAMLRLMLERRDSSGGIVIVPWEVVAALDEERLHDFDTMVTEHGLYVVSERPRRLGDPDEMFLERVANRSEVHAE